MGAISQFFTMATKAGSGKLCHSGHETILMDSNRALVSLSRTECLSPKLKMGGCPTVRKGRG